MPTQYFSVPVTSKNGLRGKVLTRSKLLDDSPEKKTIWESGREVMVPSRHLHLHSDGTYYLSLTVDPKPGTQGSVPETWREREPLHSETVIPVIEESVEVTKRVVETGRVRVQKTVTEDPVTVDEPTIYEEYDVERVAVNRVVEQPEDVRHENGVTIIPVYEEVMVKQLILREEIRLVKKRHETHAPASVTLRKEQVEVQRVRFETPQSRKPE